MADARLRVLLNPAEIAARVNALADGFAAQVDDGWTVVALLQGAIPFAADLMRAIEIRGRHPIYDSLWLESYRDARESSGKVVVRADISRAIEGRPALIVDDVFDTGLTVAEILMQLRQLTGGPLPDRIRVACPWYKPGRNLTQRQPDYHLRQTSSWLVFPHELDGLSPSEIRQKPDLTAVLDELEL